MGAPTDAGLCLAVVVFLLAYSPAWLHERYDQLVDAPPPPRQQYPWFTAHFALNAWHERGVTTVGRAMILSVVAAILISQLSLAVASRGDLHSDVQPATGRLHADTR